MLEVHSFLLDMEEWGIKYRKLQRGMIMSNIVPIKDEGMYSHCKTGRFWVRESKSKRDNLGKLHSGIGGLRANSELWKNVDNTICHTKRKFN